MSRDLKIHCTREIGFDELCAVAKSIAEGLVGARVPSIVPERSPGHESPHRPVIVSDPDDVALIAFRGIPSSVELVTFCARGIDGVERTRFSVELPTGHSAVGYLLAVSVAAALARMNNEPILDDPGYFTPGGGIKTEDEFLDEVRSGKSGIAPNELERALALFRSPYT